MFIVKYPERPFIPRVRSEKVEIHRNTGFCLTITATGDTLNTAPISLIVTEIKAQPSDRRKNPVSLEFFHYLPMETTLPANRTISLRGFVCTHATDAASMVELAISAVITPEASLTVTRKPNSKKIKFILEIRSFITTCECNANMLDGFVTVL